MKTRRIINLFTILFGTLALVAGCDSNKDTGDHLEDAGEDMQDAAEEAGEEVQDAVEDTADQVEDATN